jgi:hypothetical protein
MRELFIYYRIPVAKADEALVAVHAFQARLRARHPGLVARLLRRSESEDSLQTWMEIYAFDPLLNPASTELVEGPAHPDPSIPQDRVASRSKGVSAACQSDIESEARCLSELIAGVRHTESFVPCAS